MRKALVVLSFLSLLFVGVGPAVRTSADQVPYIRRGTWQETLLASRLALSEKLRQEGASTQTLITPVMRGGDPPRHVQVRIAGWQDLCLIVDDDGDYSNDVANWADAKVIAADGTETYLDTVEPVTAQQEWGTFKRDNKSTVNGPMQIASRVFQRGLGTHAKSLLQYKLDGKYERFDAWVGVDVSRPAGVGSVHFIVSPNTVDAKGCNEDLIWQAASRDFPDAVAQRQMGWERQDRIWESEPLEPAALAKRYAAATPGALSERAAALAAKATDPAGLQAVRDVYHRAHALADAQAQIKGLNFGALRLAITDLARTYGARYPKGAGYLKRLDALEKRATASADGQPLDPQQAIALADDCRALQREALLANPLMGFEKLLFIRRKADRLGLPQNWQSNSSLPRTGFDNEIDVLSPPAPDGRVATLYKPENGHFVGDMKLHYDAGRLLFSSVGTNDHWQVFEMGIDGKGVRQLTGDQPDVDCYDACYLPDDRILFTSTAPFIGVPCVFGSDHVTNLYRMDPDGKNIRRLTNDQDHDWCPTVLNDGRVLYLRWEYADIPHSQSRRLFSMNPDGTGQMEFYGSNSYWPNSTFYAKPVPGDPNKVVAVISGHHGVPRMGEMVLFDVSKGRYEADGAVQRIPGYGKKVEPIIRDALVDGSWPKFLHPYPLSDKYFLVASQPAPGASWGLYLVDAFDNMLLLREEPGYALLEPVPVQKTFRPPANRDKTDWNRKDSVIYLTDIYQGDGLKGVPRGTVKSLRLFSYHFAYQGMGGLLGVVGADGPWDVKRILGTVPVEADGSAYFRVPALTPISIQPLDAEGKALQLMRSWMTAVPGENLSCVGCHERQNTAPPAMKPIAFRREPSEIKPWYGPARGFSYAREVQPVIDRYCVSCHNGQSTAVAASTAPAGEKVPDLRGTVRISDFRMVTPGNGGGNGGHFSVGYAQLHRYVRRPGIESDIHLLPAKEFHADTTALVQLLQKGHYGVKLDPEAWDRLITWIDLNCPYEGTWGEDIRDPGVQRERRRALQVLYGGPDEDAEAVVATKYPSDPAIAAAPPAAPSAPAAAGASPAVPGWPFAATEAARRQAAAYQASRDPLATRAPAAEGAHSTIDLGDGVKLEMVLVPAGEFVMGDPAGCLDERPAARVRGAEPVGIGRCEGSNAQLICFDPKHDSHVEDKLAYQFGVHGFPEEGPNQPAIRVSWERAMAFCRWLSKKSGRRFSLPTEAQWEYACRAGTSTPLFYGDRDSDFSKVANLADAKLTDFASNPYTIFDKLANLSQYDDYIPKDSRFNDGGLVTVDVGSYAPNAWGLHDMHGNAAEWTLSLFQPYPYRDDDGRNEPAAAGKRVVRGGSWRDLPERARSAFRLPYDPWQRVFNVGFRVVCDVEEGGKVREARK